MILLYILKTCRITKYYLTSSNICEHLSSNMARQTHKQSLVRIGDLCNLLKSKSKEKTDLAGGHFTETCFQQYKALLLMEA